MDSLAWQLRCNTQGNARAVLVRILLYPALHLALGVAQNSLYIPPLHPFIIPQPQGLMLQLRGRVTRCAPWLRCLARVVCIHAGQARWPRPHDRHPSCEPRLHLLRSVVCVLLCVLLCDISKVNCEAAEHVADSADGETLHTTDAFTNSVIHTCIDVATRLQDWLQNKRIRRTLASFVACFLQWLLCVSFLGYRHWHQLHWLRILEKMPHAVDPC